MKIIYIAPGGSIKDAAVIRDAVFVEEQGFTMEEEYDHKDVLSHHVVIYNDNEEPIATCRFSREPQDASRYHFARIAVLKEYRGTGVGEMLLKAMEEKAVELGGTNFWLDAQKYATGFYEKMGFKVTGKEQLTGPMPHIIMEKFL